MRLRQSNGQETVHDFTEIDGEPVVRYAQARIMKQSCVDCHNTHPLSTRKDWKVGDVRGVLEIIRPLKNDEARVTQALQLTLLLSAVGSGLLLLGSVLAVWAKRRASNAARDRPGRLPHRQPQQYLCGRPELSGQNGVAGEVSFDHHRSPVPHRSVGVELAWTASQIRLLGVAKPNSNDAASPSSCRSEFMGSEERA